MTKEEKQLLLTDLCARLPYGVHLHTSSTDDIELLDVVRDLDYDEQYWINGYYDIEDIKPYLRPMSSMTEEERVEMGKAIQKDRIEPYGEIKSSGVDNLLLCSCRQATNFIDWLNAHHFDFRNLIEKDLAIEVTEDNNPYKE